MHHPDAHPPAAIRGRPKAVRRAERRLMLIQAPMLAYLVFIALQIVPGMSGLRTRGVAVAAGATTVVAVAIVGAWSVRNLWKTHRRIAAQPTPCLNCLYPLEPGQPVCPECAHFSNRSDLNPEWRRIVNKGPS